jgi:hypothetical protein
MKRHSTMSAPQKRFRYDSEIIGDDSEFVRYDSEISDYTDPNIEVDPLSLA